MYVLIMIQANCGACFFCGISQSCKIKWVRLVLMISWVSMYYGRISKAWFMPKWIKNTYRLQLKPNKKKEKQC